MIFKVSRRLCAAGSVFIFISLCLVFVLSLGAALTPLTQSPQASASGGTLPSVGRGGGTFFYLAAVVKPALYTINIALFSTLIALMSGTAAAFLRQTAVFSAGVFCLSFPRFPCRFRRF